MGMEARGMGSVSPALESQREEAEVDIGLVGAGDM
jgi:hypothetical protein